MLSTIRQFDGGNVMNNDNLDNYESNETKPENVDCVVMSDAFLRLEALKSEIEALRSQLES